MKKPAFLRNFRSSLLRAFRWSLPGVAACIMAAQANAQFNVYHPFPDSAVVWGMSTGCMDGQCGDAAYIQNYYAGDTIMDGYSYHRVQKIYVPYSSNGCCSPPDNLDAGYLREDTAARRIYWRTQGSSVDTLLYDFSVAVGDTLQGYMGNCDLTWTVGSIDSILIGPSYRKQINYEVIFSPGVQFSIIEGVGSIYGLTTCPFIPFEMGITLICYTVGGNVLYSPFGPDLTACGDLASSVHAFSPRSVTPIQLLPNPTADIVKLVRHTEQPPLDLMIYDVTGKAVYRSRITQEQSLIDLTSLGKGIYMALVFQDGALLRSEKLVKL